MMNPFVNVFPHPAKACSKLTEPVSAQILSTTSRCSAVKVAFICIARAFTIRSTFCN